MGKTCCDLIKDYRQFLCSKIFAEKNDFGCTIYTSVLGPDNDPYRVYIEDLGFDRFKVTDYGNTLYELDRVELDYTTEHKITIINRALKSSGAVLNQKNNSLEIVCSYDHISSTIERILQAMVEISHLRFFSTAESDYEFNVIVHDFLTENDIHPIFDRNGIRVHLQDMQLRFDMQLSGIANSDYGVLIQTLHVENRESSLNKSRYKTSNYMMLRLAKKNFIGVAIVDELDGKWTPSAKSWLSNSCDKVFNWSDKDEIVTFLRPLSR